MPRVASSLAALALAACASASPTPITPPAATLLAGVPTAPPPAAAPRTLPRTETLPPSEGGSDAAASRTFSGARGRARPLDLDVKDADLHDVCALIADVARVNIVVAVEAHPRVTVKMRGVPWDVALDTIVRSKGLIAEWQGALIVVRDPAKGP